MSKYRFLGSKYTVLSSTALLVVSAYELSVRFESMYKPLKMFFSMAAGESISLSAAMKYFDYSMFEAPIWLLVCALTALITIFFVRRPAGAVVTLPLSVILAAYGLMRESSFLTDVWRLIQPGLLLFNAVVIAANLLTVPIRRRADARPDASAPDAPHMHDAPRLRSLARKEADDRTDRSA